MGEYISLKKKREEIKEKQKSLSLLANSLKRNCK